MEHLFFFLFLSPTLYDTVDFWGATSFAHWESASLANKLLNVFTATNPTYQIQWFQHSLTMFDLG